MDLDTVTDYRKEHCCYIEPMTLSEVLDALYASEINVAIESNWDAGWEVKIGDEVNGYVAEANFHPWNANSPVESARDYLTLDDAAHWLYHEATRIYPESPFARTVHKGCLEPAVFQIYAVRVTPEPPYVGVAGPDVYSDDTYACEAHVGELLTFQPDAVETGNIYWHVRTLAPAMLSR